MHCPPHSSVAASKLTTERTLDTGRIRTQFLQVRLEVGLQCLVQFCTSVPAELYGQDRSAAPGTPDVLRTRRLHGAECRFRSRFY